MFDNLTRVDASPFESFTAKSIPVVFTGHGNECFSPLSLYLALSLVALGADGAGQEELLDVLDATDAKELAKSCKNVYRTLCPPSKPKNEQKTDHERRMRELFGGEDREKIVLANSLWVNTADGYSVTKGYEKTFKKIMNGQVRAVDFDDVADEVSSWARESTDGFLSPSVSVSPDDQMLLANLLYYKGNWRDAFYEKGTRTDVFHAPDKDVEADFMHDNDKGCVYEGDGFICASRPLGRGKMTFFLPDEGIDVETLVDTPERVDNLLSVRPDEQAQINWLVPKFDIASKLNNLNDCVEKLGASRMFAPSDMFEKMLSGLDADKSYISQISQEMRVKIDEKGCEAAAMSMCAIACLGGSFVEKRVDFNLNRPSLSAGENLC